MNSPKNGRRRGEKYSHFQLARFGYEWVNQEKKIELNVNDLIIN